ncbi:MAG: hypothetical protein GX339_06045 [Tissierellia bacterium]|nr:hypothetical protein [Tissierellia bacterium]
MGYNKWNTAGASRRRCHCVYECLLELLEDALENKNHDCCDNRRPDGGSFKHDCGGLRPDFRRRCNCQCVFECLLELLEDEEDIEDGDFCKCPR